MTETSFIPIAELTERLDMTKGGVYARIARGAIPAVRTRSGRIVVPRAAFEARIAGQVERALATVEPVGAA